MSGREFPLDWKRSYWPEPKLGAKREDWSFRPSRIPRKKQPKAALIALAEID